MVGIGQRGTAAKSLDKLEVSLAPLPWESLVSLGVGKVGCTEVGGIYLSFMSNDQLLSLEIHFNVLRDLPAARAPFSSRH